jgi:hypothetical protein
MDDTTVCLTCGAVLYLSGWYLSTDGPSLCSQTFFVQPNLFSFLEVIRTDTEIRPRHYWIDAMCIDQHNVRERNHQVAQMGEIYARAQRTLIWLGHPTTDILVFRAFHTQPVNAKADHASLVTGFITDVQNNPYWSHSWITQELVLARRIIVMLGYDKIGFRKLRRSLGEYGIGTSVISPVHQFAQLEISTRSSLVEKSLVNLLYHFAERECGLA